MVQTDKESKSKQNEYTNPEHKVQEKTLIKLEYKTDKHVIYVTNRLKILSHYSKQISNSNIPCCNCCGENSHVDFLAIDHMAGKNQMDSEPELIKLGYSSKLKGKRLINWIIEK